MKSTLLMRLDEAFETMFDASRANPVPACEARLDRSPRLRALSSDNETRVGKAISTDFGHRSRMEMLFAETLFTLGERQYAIKHLKKWLAPRHRDRAAIHAGEEPSDPQTLGMLGIIILWKCPLQLTLAPAFGALAAADRVMIKASELTSNFREEIANAFTTLSFDHLIFAARLGSPVWSPKPQSAT